MSTPTEDIKLLLNRHPNAKSFKDFVDAGNKLAVHWAGDNNKNLAYWERAFDTFKHHGFQAKALLAPNFMTISQLYSECSIIGDGFTIFGTRADGFTASPQSGELYLTKNQFSGKPSLAYKSGSPMWTRGKLTKEALDICTNMFGHDWRQCNPSFNAIRRTDGAVLITIRLQISPTDSFTIERWFCIIRDKSTMFDVMGDGSLKLIANKKVKSVDLHNELDNQLKAGNWVERHYQFDEYIEHPKSPNKFSYKRYYDDHTGEYVVSHGEKIIGRTGNIKTSHDIVQHHVMSVVAN